MKENKIEKLILDLSAAWKCSPEEVVDRLNSMDESEINKLIKNTVKKFFTGGFINQDGTGGYPFVLPTTKGTYTVTQGSNPDFIDEEFTSPKGKVLRSITIRPDATDPKKERRDSAVHIYPDGEINSYYPLIITSPYKNSKTLLSPEQWKQLNKSLDERKMEALSFKNGGMIDCLRAGGSINTCKCGKKIAMNSGGEIVRAKGGEKISRQDALNAAIISGLRRPEARRLYRSLKEEYSKPEYGINFKNDLKDYVREVMTSFNPQGKNYTQKDLYEFREPLGPWVGKAMERTNNANKALLYSRGLRGRAAEQEALNQTYAHYSGNSLDRKKMSMDALLEHGKTVPRPVTSVTSQVIRIPGPEEIEAENSSVTVPVTTQPSIVFKSESPKLNSGESFSLNAPQAFAERQNLNPPALSRRERFNQAFAEARRSGKEIFEFEGGKYNTKLKSENPTLKGEPSTLSRRERFNQAFAAARRNGAEIFEFEGGKYNTKLA